MRRLWLIAAREFNAYVAAPSFWLALLTGPLIMGAAALLLASAGGNEPATRTMAIRSSEPALVAAAAASLREAAEVEGWRLDLSGKAPATTLAVSRQPSGAIAVVVEGEPASRLTAAMLRRDLAHAAAQERLRRAGVPADVLADSAVEVQVRRAPSTAAPRGDDAAPGRFALMMLLWMNLIGALGMLMQAIVRERANRALESLLAAARPAEVLFGKLAGVGAVSVLVIAGWGAGAGALAAAAAEAGAGAPVAAVLQVVLAAWREPALLAQAGLVYGLAFLMYGSALVGLGALARDLPAAQNLARPVFAILLMVFFAALARMGAAGEALGWLVWVPPFTPFMLLMEPADALGQGERIAAIALLAACALGTAIAAPLSLQDRGRMRLWARPSPAGG